MKKAIATKPNQMTQHIDLTEDEILIRQAEEQQFLDDKPMAGWLDQMAILDNKMPRSLEDMIDAKGIEGFSQFIIDKYNEKKTLRALKPNGEE